MTKKAEVKQTVDKIIGKGTAIHINDKVLPEKNIIPQIVVSTKDTAKVPTTIELQFSGIDLSLDGLPARVEILKKAISIDYKNKITLTRRINNIRIKRNILGQIGN